MSVFIKRIPSPVHFESRVARASREELVCRERDVFSTDLWSARCGRGGLWGCYSFASEAVGWAVGSRARVVYTEDGGRAWRPIVFGGQLGGSGNTIFYAVQVSLSTCIPSVAFTFA